MKLTSLLIGSFGLFALASVADAADVGGHYKVAGTNKDGSKYSGTADITVSSNSTCRIVWHSGDTHSSGNCMRVNGTLVAGYVLEGSVGLVAYTIKDDGTLD